MIYKLFLVVGLLFNHGATFIMRNFGLVKRFQEKCVSSKTIKYVSPSNNKNISSKQIITISPGGFKGFYTLGVCKFIKENYDLSNYVFSGASAGAWISLMLTYKGSFEKISNRIVEDDTVDEIDSLYNIEKVMKEKILNNYCSTDFALENLFIGTTVLEKYQFKTIIYAGFTDLEDAVNCCVASSHIPFFTGGLRYKYRNLLSFDGGFSQFPYITPTVSSIHITPHIWEGTDLKNITLRSKKPFTSKQLVINGYLDARANKKQLDDLLSRRTHL